MHEARGWAKREGGGESGAGGGPPQGRGLASLRRQRPWHGRRATGSDPHLEDVVKDGHPCGSKVLASKSLGDGRALQAEGALHLYLRVRHQGLANFLHARLPIPFAKRDRLRRCHFLILGDLGQHRGNLHAHLPRLVKAQLTELRPEIGRRERSVLEHDLRSSDGGQLDVVVATLE